MANRIGRKKTLYVGLFISLVGTILTLYADTYLLLCVGRFIQAFGCSVALKIGYTMVGDLHAGADATKVLSYAMLAYAILPGIGTAISGFLVPSFGWRGGFWFFLLFTLALILSCLLLPETSKKRDLSSLRIKNIAYAYSRQFKDLDLVLWSCLMGLSTAIIFIFAQEAPFLVVDQMGFSPQEYGVFYLVPAFGIAGGSLATAWLADKMTPLTAMLVGILTMLIGSLLMGYFFLGSWVNGWALFLPQVIVQFGDAILYTNASSIALSEADDKSNASAIMLFINSIVSVAGTFLAGVFAPRALLSLPIVFIIITAIMLLIWLKLHRQKI
jgi:DHA1 family bicyclomycin/chloramphenicol resistance-like MFS transporter